MSVALCTSMCVIILDALFYILKPSNFSDKIVSARLLPLMVIYFPFFSKTEKVNVPS
jgi:hypothetical protein